MTSWILPLSFCGIVIYGYIRRVDIVSSFIAGAKEGLKTSVSILPPLLLILTVIGMLRASGGLEQIARFLSPVCAAVGIPPETVSLVLLRPLSGSGSLAAMEDILNQYGADSIIGRTAAVMTAATETTFYTAAVYFGAVGVKNSRYAIPCALLGDITAVIVAALTVRIMFS